MDVLSHRGQEDGDTSEYHQFLTSICGEGSHAHASGGRPILRDFTLDPSYLAFSRQRATMGARTNLRGGVVGRGTSTGNANAISSSSSGEALYMAPSRHRNIDKSSDDRSRNGPLQLRSYDAFDGHVDNSDGKENEDQRFSPAVAKSISSKNRSASPPPASTPPVEVHVDKAIKSILKHPSGSTKAFQKTKGESCINGSLTVHYSNQDTDQLVPDPLPESEVHENQKPLLGPSSILMSSFNLAPLDGWSQPSTERRPFSTDEVSQESCEGHQETRKVDRESKQGVPMYQTPKWVDEAIKEAQLTRVKGYPCLASLANDQMKGATDATERSSQAISEDHGAVRSISSGNQKSLYQPQLSKARTASRFASPINLSDGAMDGDAGSKPESHISQGFISHGNRINCANAHLLRILVTGGAGFIGSHLVKRLLELGHAVVVLDNLVTGSMRNLKEVDGHPRLAFIDHDVLNPLPKRLVVDEVYHLACPSSPFFWQNNLITTFNIIVEGTKNVLNFAQKSGAKVLYASTTEVYGNPESGVEVQSEIYKGSVDCFSERASHDEAKRAAETLCFAYQAERKLDIRIARIGSTYGPKMGKCDGSMVSSFASALVEGVEVQISEPIDTTCTRTFLYIDDCVSGLIKLMNSNYTDPINIAGDDVLSVKDLLLQLRTFVANPSNAIPWKTMEFYPDSGTRRPANAAAFVNLGWYPAVKVKDGLRATVLWYKEDKDRTRGSSERGKEADTRVTARRERKE